MSQHKKQQTKDRRTSKRKRTATTYNLELLESRVLLSADLAGAVQVMPIKPAQAPQAVVLNVPGGHAATQQTFSVSELLARQASSFPQQASEPSRHTIHTGNHAPDSVLSERSHTQTHTVSEIISQSRQARPQLPTKQSGITSQPMTPTVQPQPSTPAGSTSVAIELGASSLQPAPVPLMQIQPIPIATTAMQSDIATMPSIVQSPVSQELTPSASGTVLLSSRISADGLLPLPAPTLQSQEQPIVTTPLAVIADPLPEVPTIPITQIVAQPALSTPQLSSDGLPLPPSVPQIQGQPIPQPIVTAPNEPSQNQTIFHSLVAPVQTAPASPVVSVPTVLATGLVTPQGSLEQTVPQPVAAPPSTASVPISAPSNSGLTTSNAVNPQLPQAYVDTSMPSTSLTVRVGPHGDYTDPQTALNSVSLGTTILLEPGVSYTSSNDVGFILPNKTTGTGWIVIRPDVPDSALPAPGTRATPADSAMMPKIIRGDLNLYAMSVAPGAHNYRIIGLEFMNKGNVNTPYNGTFVNLDGQEGSVSAQSNHIVLDRVYIHGPSAPGALGVKFGIVLGGQYQAVIDSDIEDLVSPDGESKAIAMWDGAGPIKIQNNLLSAAGENIMIGGADPVITGLVPSDIEIRNNNFFKPLKWKDAAYASPSSGYAVATKNLFELKNAQRVLVDGNVFENVWYPNNQSGFAIMITPRNQDATAPWTVVQDVTFTNNKITGAASGIAISGFDSNWTVGHPSQHGGRMLFQNNLIVNLGTDPSIDINRGTGKLFMISNGVSDLHIIHNTVASYVPGTAGQAFVLTYGVGDEHGLFPLNGLIIQDNLLRVTDVPLIASAPLSNVAPGAVWTNTVLAGPWPTPVGYLPTSPVVLPQAIGNSYPPAESSIGYTNAFGGDYRLAASSPYKNAASDGKDIGVDWTLFDAVQNFTNGS